MRMKKEKSNLPFGQRVTTFLERFKYISSLAWIISTGLVAFATALLSEMFPTMNRVVKILIFAVLFLLSLVVAIVFMLFQPSLSQLLFESEYHYNSGAVALETQDYKTAYKELYSAYKINKKN